MRENELWDFFSLKQEFNPVYTDKFDRFPYVLNNYNCHEPILSQYLVEKGFKPTYPDGKKMAVCISHDIDHLLNDKWPLKTMLNQQRKAILSGNYSKFSQNLQFRERHLNESYSVKNLIDFLKVRGIRSTLYFLSLSKGDDDFSYRLSEVLAELEYVQKHGFEIGLHGGHRAYKDLPKLLQEKSELEAATKMSMQGYRNHYLRFDYPLTLENLSKANFKYDTTYGHAEHIGFRNGMCFPFQPYNQRTQNFIDIYELPLLVMDDTLYNYMSLETEAVYDYVVNLVQKVKSVNGVFTLLWHNNVMQGEKGKMFRRIVDMLEEKNVWFATGNELIEWYEERGYFEEMMLHLEELRSSAEKGA